MRKGFRFVLLTVLLVAGLIGAAAFIFRQGEERPPALEGRVVRVGYAREPPFSYRDADGEVTGESPEVARRVLRRLGIEQVRWVLVDFNSLIPELRAGNIDVIAAGMFVTPERSALIAFSLPTARVGQGLLVRRGNPKDLHCYEDVAARPDVTAAVLDGAVEQHYLQELGVPENRIFTAPDAATAVAAVRLGRADCLALSAPTVNLMARDNPELEAARPFADPVIQGRLVMGFSAFGFRKSDKELLSAVNARLREFIGTPEHLETVRPFGFGPENLPGGEPGEQGK